MPMFLSTLFDFQDSRTAFNEKTALSVQHRKPATDHDLRRSRKQGDG